MRVLGIETSCDETAVCLIDASGTTDDFSSAVLGNTLYSQAALQYGGVFPNLAKREHAKNFVPLLEDTLRQADCLTEAYADISAYRSAMSTLLEREQELFSRLWAFAEKYKAAPIDAIAVTVGPGLEPALWVGINFARALSQLWSVPIVAVNHMECHVVMPMMEHSVSHTVDDRTHYGNGKMREFGWPVLSLLISGGHTELVLSDTFRAYKRIGETRDDAAGEAFDKVARLMDLPYPGGPEISRLAAEARARGIEPAFKFTRPMLTEDNFDFSFSGLKNAVRLKVEELKPLDDAKKMQIAREFEDTVADVLIEKTMRAAEEYGAKTLVVGGGVSANTRIRKLLAERVARDGMVEKVLVPTVELATDNALMIALAGYFAAARSKFMAAGELQAQGNLKLETEP
jgi:N6-L-threonylcarbamoyladenine synthase